MSLITDLEEGEEHARVDRDVPSEPLSSFVFSVSGLVFGVWGLGFRVQGLGFRV